MEQILVQAAPPDSWEGKLYSEMIRKEPNKLVNSPFVIFNFIYTASEPIFQIYNISQEGEALLQSRPLTAAFDSVITFASFHENIQPIWEFENALRLHVGIIFTPGSELRLVSAHIHSSSLLFNLSSVSGTNSNSQIQVCRQQFLKSINV